MELNNASSKGTAAHKSLPDLASEPPSSTPAFRTLALLCNSRQHVRLPLLAVGAHDEPKPEPCWDGSYMLLPLRSDAGGDEAGTLRGPDRVLFSALLFARVASSFARIAVTTLCVRAACVLSSCSAPRGLAVPDELWPHAQ